MNTKNPTISIRMLQIIVVFILSALISQTSFAATNACDMKRLSQEAKLFNNNIDPDLQVSINVDKCRMTLVGRNCAITPFNSYQLTTLPRLPDQSMLQALKIQSFGPNTEGNGYILAIPKCAG
jgi:hypothetical protein